jgi:TatD DNase family protein
METSSGIGKTGGVLFDSHNHLQSGRFGKPVGELVAEMRAAGIAGCVVNATREDDWEAVAALARGFPDYVFPAYGIHPWFADTAAEGWEDRLREKLSADPTASVGEVGVDGWVDSPGMGVQLPVFVKQAEIAAELGRVMTVHCLKAWEPLFGAMDRAAAWPGKFLMHSFGGSVEVADRLLKKGAWFSFSGHFLHPRKAKVLEVFRKLPADRILLETDAPDMIPPEEWIAFPLAEGANHPANLRSIAEAFDTEMGGGMLEKFGENGKRFWGCFG